MIPSTISPSFHPLLSLESFVPENCPVTFILRAQGVFVIFIVFALQVVVSLPVFCDVSHFSRCGGSKIQVITNYLEIIIDRRRPAIKKISGFILDPGFTIKLSGFIFGQIIRPFSYYREREELILFVQLFWFDHAIFSLSHKIIAGLES